MCSLEVAWILYTDLASSSFRLSHCFPLGSFHHLIFLRKKKTLLFYVF